VDFPKDIDGMIAGTFLVEFLFSLNWLTLNPKMV
jgi:hypothetical protein